MIHQTYVRWASLADVKSETSRVWTVLVCFLLKKAICNLRRLD